MSTDPITLLGLRLTDKPVVAVGGGAVTARRVRDLLADGALVTVITPAVSPDLAELAAEATGGRLTIVRRCYAGPADLDGAWLVHTATGDLAVDAQVSADAAAQRTWCINAGDAERATAHVPARGTVELGDATLRVAVHGGRDPRRAVVARNAAVEHLSTGVVDLRGRRENPGWVALVGAGPGDDGLITRRASALLASADVVVTDRLVPTGTLALLPPQVRIIDVGKQPNHHPVPQHEINAILVREALAGHGVVRFKGGDPYVLGRGGEERLACEAAGVPVEVVPGITSAIAVPAAAGIPVTHRGVSRGFTVVTGHDDLGDLPTGADHTVVILMGVGTLARSTAVLRAARADSTPVAIIERGCTPHQRVTVGTLGDIVGRADAVGVENPAVIVVGDVVRLADAWSAAAMGYASHTPSAGSPESVLTGAPA